MSDDGTAEELPNWSMALKGLSTCQLAQVDERFVRRAYPSGALVFGQAERSEGFFVIDSGHVRLFYTSETGKEYVSGIWSSGYPLGLVSMMLQERRIQSVQAIDRLVLRSMPRDQLLDLMLSIPRFSVNVSWLLAAMARYSIARSGLLALDSSAARLGRVMARLAVPEGRPGDARHAIRGIRQDELARMVGASRPWVSLTLGSFERRGLIERRRGYIAIADMVAFERFLSSADGF
ncbi:MAG: Crp/Fnr family transcriptional regulator [Burkholderiaceae bacterium]